MKKKYFLRGLGAGIVLSTMVLMFANSAESKNEIADSEIRKRALELGMVETSTEEPDTNATKEPNKEVDTTPEPTKEVATQKPKETTEPKKTASPTKKPEATKKPQEQKEGKYFTLNIVAGMWSEKIAATLYDAGVIKSAKEFDDFLSDNGYASNIKIGIYQIPKNATYAQIANIIAKK